MIVMLASIVQTIQSAAQATATTDTTNAIISIQPQPPIDNTTNAEQLFPPAVNTQTEFEDSITTINDVQIQNAITHQANQIVNRSTSLRSQTSVSRITNHNIGYELIIGYMIIRLLMISNDNNRTHNENGNGNRYYASQTPQLQRRQSKSKNSNGNN